MVGHTIKGRERRHTLAVLVEKHDRVITALREIGNVFRPLAQPLKMTPCHAWNVELRTVRLVFDSMVIRSLVFRGRTGFVGLSMTSCTLRWDIANSPDGDAQTNRRAVIRLQYGESGSAFAMRVKREEGRRHCGCHPSCFSFAGTARLHSKCCHFHKLNTDQF